MDEFKEYLKFQDIEKANEFTSVLQKHNIPFQLDDVSMPSRIISNSDPWENKLILKLKESDIERAEKAFDTELDNEVRGITNEHYLYSFDDKDILDIIANPGEWTKVEVKLAIKIANERNLDLSAQAIKEAKKTVALNPLKQVNISNTASSFWVIAVFTIANSFLLRRNINFHLPGLAIADASEYAFAKLYGAGNKLGFITSIVMATVFFLFARYGKKNKWVFLSGLIIYCLDSILNILTPRWGTIIFIFIILWNMITGLANTFKEEKETLDREASQ